MASLHSQPTFTPEVDAAHWRAVSGAQKSSAFESLPAREQIMLQRQQLLAKPACNPQDFMNYDQEIEAESPPLQMNAESPFGPGETVESRRQFHLACEQLRRRNIKDGLDELKACLPHSESNRFTKAAVISKAVSFIHQLQRQRDMLLSEITQLKGELNHARSTCTCGACAVDASTTPPGPEPTTSARKFDYPPIQPKIAARPISPPDMPPSATSMRASLPYASVPLAPQQPWIDSLQQAEAIMRATDTVPLPANWDTIACPDNRTLFVNRLTQQTSWVHPMLRMYEAPPASLPQPPRQSQQTPLMSDWKPANGSSVFVDQSTQRGFWPDARPQQRQQQWTPAPNASSPLISFGGKLLHNMPQNVQPQYLVSNSSDPSISPPMYAKLETDDYVVHPMNEAPMPEIAPPYDSLFTADALAAN